MDSRIGSQRPTTASIVDTNTYMPDTIVTGGAGADLQAALDALPAAGGMVYAKDTHWDIGTKITIGVNEALVFQPFCEIEPTANVDIFQQKRNSLLDGNGAHINLRDYGSWVGKDVFQFDGADLFGQFATYTHWTTLRNFHVLGETAGNETGNGIHMFADGNAEYVAWVLCDNIHFERMAAAIRLYVTGGAASPNQTWISENTFTNMRGGANVIAIDMERDDAKAGNTCNLSGNSFWFRESVGANSTYVYRVHGRQNRINDYSVDFQNLGTACVEFRADADDFTRDNWVTFNRTGPSKDEVLNNSKQNFVQGIANDANHLRNPWSVSASEEADAGSTLVESEPLMFETETWNAAARVQQTAGIQFRPDATDAAKPCLELLNAHVEGAGGAAGDFLVLYLDGVKLKLQTYANA